LKATWVFMPGAWVASVIIWFLGGARIEGVERIPRSGPFLLVANHCSQFDPPLLGWATGYQVRRVIYFMGKEEMRHWPIIGWLAERSGVFFVRRGEGDRAAQRQALDLWASGKPVGIFAEGTRSRDGRMRAIKPGAALLAIRAGVPILPVGIAGTHRLFSRGWLPRRSNVTFRIGEPFTLPHQPDGRLNRQALTAGTERITAEIAALLPSSQRPNP
jgi:1-acyl-sn-glycerol-3-phosphate acyltransferase